MSLLSCRRENKRVAVIIHFSWVETKLWTETKPTEQDIPVKTKGPAHKGFDRVGPLLHSASSAEINCRHYFI